MVPPARPYLTKPLTITGWFLLVFGLFALLGAVVGRDAATLAIALALLVPGGAMLLGVRRLEARWAAEDERRARLRATGTHLPAVVTARRRRGHFRSGLLGHPHEIWRYTLQVRPPGAPSLTFEQVDLAHAEVGDELVACSDGTDAVTRDDLTALALAR